MTADFQNRHSNLAQEATPSDDLAPLAEKLALAGVALAAGRRDQVAGVLRSIRSDVDKALRNLADAEPIPGQTTIHDQLREAS